MTKTVDEIIAKYYAEAAGGLSTRKVPSELKRGEGTEAEYFIFKIDLCNSTILLYRRPSQTYLKIAHVFLSSIDDITRTYGADTKQVEYAGDSVLSYFPNYNGMAINVLSAAYFSRLAVLKMKTLDSTFNTFSFKTKIVLHHSKLILGKIGPWGDNNLTAIGLPIHHVTKLEKSVQPGDGIATKGFADKLSSMERKHFLIPNYVEKQVQIQNPTPSMLGQLTTSNAMVGGLRDYQQAINRNSLLSATGLLTQEKTRISALSGLLNPVNTRIDLEPQYRIEKELVNYSVNWSNIHLFLQGSIKI